MVGKKILIINTGGTLSAVMKKNGLIPGLSIHDMHKELQMVSGDTQKLYRVIGRPGIQRHLY